MDLSANSISSFATALAVLVAAWQIREGRKQARTQFEDDMAREYREIVQRIPVEALLGKSLSRKSFEKALDDFYRYIDLSNGQVFLRQQGRLSRRTWIDWRSGMKSNLSKPAFKIAWDYIKNRTDEDQFGELRRVEAEKYDSDPRWWSLRDLFNLMMIKT